MHNIIFWCEFPETLNWKKVQSTLTKLNFKVKIYIPCKDKAQYQWWKQELKKNAKNIIEVNVWPIIAKEEGYWFSGFTKIHNIDRLKEFKDENIKIDLEMPIHEYTYSYFKMIKYLLRYLFKKAPNTTYLLNTIFSLNKTSDILINEFPLPKFLLKRWGCYVPPKKGIRKNIMSYPTLFPKWYIKHFIKKAFQKNKEISVSIGLIGTGILNNEPIYKSIKQLEKDLNMVKKIGIKNIAVYSLDSIFKRKNPKDWLKSLQTFSQS